MRPVKSRILWEQMLGRGTRLCPDINKEKFTIFDCFNGTLVAYFKDVSNFKFEGISDNSGIKISLMIVSISFQNFVPTMMKTFGFNDPKNVFKLTSK